MLRFCQSLFYKLGIVRQRRCDQCQVAVKNTYQKHEAQYGGDGWHLRKDGYEDDCDGDDLFHIDLFIGDVTKVKECYTFVNIYFTIKCLYGFALLYEGERRKEWEK